MKLSNIARRLLGAAATFALLTASTPALAESLSASDSAACCSTDYCSVHHRQSRDTQTDKSNCAVHGERGAADCSMRSCDAAVTQAVGTSPFTLAAPLTIFYEATAQAAPLSLPRFFPFVVSLPSTPPPRTLPT